MDILACVGVVENELDVDAVLVKSIKAEKLIFPVGTALVDEETCGVAKVSGLADYNLCKKVKSTTF